MKIFKLIFYSALLAAIAAVFIFRGEIADYIRPQIKSKLQEFEKEATDALVKEIKKQIETVPKIETPPPLRAPIIEVSGTGKVILTASGIVNWTNVERVSADQEQLSRNTKLDEIAALRLKDMFEKQYFGHVSQSGEDIGDSADLVGYEYIRAGENLAMGNFSDDRDLVEAWMASPGHRANILNSNYTEIGVAVKKGLFEEKLTWLAVQVFGKPLSLCSEPSAEFKSRLEILSSGLKEMRADLGARREDIEKTNHNTPDYNDKVDEYNVLIAEYNIAVEEFKKTVADYNLQIERFNKCIEN